MIDLSSDEGVGQAIREVASWPATPAATPGSVATFGRTAYPPRSDRTRWWAAAAVLVVVVAGALLAVRGDSRVEVAAAQGTWLPMAEFPLVPRHEPSTLWTGSELVVWGGYADDGTVFTDGAIYDPGTDMWRAMAGFPFEHWQRQGVPVGADGSWATRPVVGAVIDGQAVYITANPIDHWAWDVVSYDLATDSWRLLEENRFDQLPSEQLVQTAGGATVDLQAGLVAWRGQLVVVGWRSDLGEVGWATVTLDDGGNPVWSPFHEIVGGDTFYSRNALEGGPALIDDRYLVWLRDGQTMDDRFGYRIDLETGTSSLVSYPADPTNGQRVHVTGAMTDRGLVVGTTTNPDGMSTRFAWQLDPVTLTWNDVEAAPAGGATDFDDGPRLVSTSQGHLLLGGISVDGRRGGLRVESVRLAADPRVERWATLPDPPISLDRADHFVVWTGDEVIVWGGATVDPEGSVNVAVVPAVDGARYKLPATDDP